MRQWIEGKPPKEFRRRVTAEVRDPPVGDLVKNHRNQSRNGKQRDTDNRFNVHTSGQVSDAAGASNVVLVSVLVLVMVWVLVLGFVIVIVFVMVRIGTDRRPGRGCASPLHL